MQANDITRERLRRLAGIRAGEAKVLSLFLNLDPREFATAAGAQHRGPLGPGPRGAPDPRGRGARPTPRARRCAPTSSASRPSSAAAAWTPGAPTAWPSSPPARPTSSRCSGSQSPSTTSRSSPTPRSSSRCRPSGRPSAGACCSSTAAWRGSSAVRARRSRRSSSSRTTLRRRHDQGGWSQANYQRSIDKDVADHLRHAAKVAFAHLQARSARGDPGRRPRTSSPATSRAICIPTCASASPAGWTSTSSTRAPTTCAAPRAPSIEQAARAREDEALARLAEAFGAGQRTRRQRPAGGARRRPRAARGDPARRRRLRGARRRAAPRAAGWGPSDAAACPADGSATERLDDVVEAAVERSLTQAADVRVLRDRAELASHGHVAAVLRF